ncbi:MAG: GFA family protein [Pseudomonadota bacterium]
MTLRATCHCGAIELTLTEAAPLETAKRCDCSFCKRRQGANISVPLHALKVTKGAENLGVYSWHTHTAKHYFCKICGIYTHHQRRAATDEYGVNIGCLEDVSPADLEPIPTTDGRNYA